jgi:hypothetical protein
VLETLAVSAELPGIASLRTPSFDLVPMYLEARSHHDGWFAEGDVESALAVPGSAGLDPSFTSALAGQGASASRYFRPASLRHGGSPLRGGALSAKAAASRGAGRHGVRRRDEVGRSPGPVSPAPSSSRPATAPLEET